MAHSAEEEVARNFICFGGPDAVAVVCDATCLERNLNLVLQTMEISSRVVVCVNLLDEAKRKRIRIDLAQLSEKLGVPVVGTVARKKKSLDALLRALDGVTGGGYEAKKSLYGAVSGGGRGRRRHCGAGAARTARRPAQQPVAEPEAAGPDDSLIREINAYLGEDFCRTRRCSRRWTKPRACLSAAA